MNDQNQETTAGAVAGSTVNEIQELQLRLIELSSFNEFDGPEIAASLRANRDVWEAVIIDRAAYFALARYNEHHDCDPIDLIRLRDLSQGYWNVDTLYILPRDADALEKLAGAWSADEVDWINDPNAGRVLRVWFD